RLLHVGDEDADHVGRLHRRARLFGLPAVLGCLRPGLAVGTEADPHVAAAVAQVHRVRAALAAVAQDDDALTFERFGLCVLFPEHLGGHSFLRLPNRWGSSPLPRKPRRPSPRTSPGRPTYSWAWAAASPSFSS